MEYDGGSQTVDALAGGSGSSSSGSYYNLILNGSGTKTLAGTTKIYGDLTLTAGDFEIGGATIYPNGNINRSSGNLVAASAANITYSTGSSHNICAFSDNDITINTSGTTTKTITTTGNIDCKSIDLSNPNSTFVIDGETVTLDVDLDVDEGTMKITSGVLNVNQNSSSAVTITGSTSTLDIDGGTVNIGESGHSESDLVVETTATVDVSGGTFKC